jgi:regulator of nucleoside diphosphate kinase
MDRREIVVTQSDMEKLQRLIEARRAYARDLHHLNELENELERATVLPASRMPKDVVTMHSRVWIRDMRTGEHLEYEIVFPREADLSDNRISILAPIATALLGYRTGAIVEWDVPGGKRKLRIEAVEMPSAVAA